MGGSFAFTTEIPNTEHQELLLPFEHVGCYADTSTRALPSGPSSVVAVVKDGSDPTFSLAECHGDCDSDTDCIGHLLCYQRDEWTDPMPAGCSGDPHGRMWDYCYDPMKDTVWPSAMAIVIATATASVIWCVIIAMYGKILYRWAARVMRTRQCTIIATIR